MFWFKYVREGWRRCAGVGWGLGYVSLADYAVVEIVCLLGEETSFPTERQRRLGLSLEKDDVDG
jgi:hypothetical protein